MVLVGVPGLRWADVSARATPELWRLARQGSVGSLSVTGLGAPSCPADGWLMLNAGARGGPRTAAGSCAGLPAAAQMPAIVSANQADNENPGWGMLRSAAGPGQCTTAAGPGAALALASRSGQLGSFRPGVASLTRAELARCPLTVVGLGSLRAAPGLVRATDVRADDREIGRISAALPAGTILVVAGISDDAAPHLRLLVVRGPGFRSGLLVSPSTRQRGLVLLLDLPVSVLHWLGLPVPSTAVGQVLHRVARSSLVTAVSGLAGQDTAAQVYLSDIGLVLPGPRAGRGRLVHCHRRVAMGPGRNPGAPPARGGPGGRDRGRKRARGHLPGQPGALVDPAAPRLPAVLDDRGLGAGHRGGRTARSVAP